MIIRLNRITISDIAKMANVSTTTVYKALNGKEKISFFYPFNRILKEKTNISERDIQRCSNFYMM